MPLIQLIKGHFRSSDYLLRHVRYPYAVFPLIAAVLLHRQLI